MLQLPISFIVFRQNVSNIFMHISISGKLLSYNFPYVYDHSLPAEFVNDNPYIESVINGTHETEAPCTLAEKLTSIGGESFTAFAKCSKFGKGSYIYFYSFLLFNMSNRNEISVINECNCHAKIKTVCLRL